MSRYLAQFGSTFPPEQRRVVKQVPENFEDLEENIIEEQSEEVPELHENAVQFARSVITEAIRRGASDIHFEPKINSYFVRYRVDGVLYQYLEKPLEEYQTILNAIKVLADLNIAEHAVPQDGHIELMRETSGDQIKEREERQKNHPSLYQGVKDVEMKHYYDIRVSVFPSVNGEVVVMRVLNRDTALLTIEQLGMDTESLHKLHEVLLTSYGMLLVTGPTGSGKTTTLYSILSELKSDEKNIITLEDPIEFHLDWLRQCEMRVERGFTFETAMASILRQDPDILMVGEIRDGKTAEYAIRSALVGRIVGSTIHANTTIGTIARLLELGIPRSTIGHSINAIIAQRLVRRTCDSCKEEYRPSESLLKHLGMEHVTIPFYRGAGCEKCRNTGFMGRTGIFSVMVFDEVVRSMLFDQRSLMDIETYVVKNGMRTLKMDAVAKIMAGLTTVEEASRVI